MNADKQIVEVLELLKSSNISSYKIAKDTGLSESIIGRWRNGTTRPSRANARLLLQYFSKTGAVSTPEPAVLAQSDIETLKDFIETLKKNVSMLENQISEKDKQIAELGIQIRNLTSALDKAMNIRLGGGADEYGRAAAQADEGLAARQ